MSIKFDDAWLETEIRWAEWNGQEFQCVDASSAREMLAEIKRLADKIDRERGVSDSLRASCAHWERIARQHGYDGPLDEGGMNLRTGDQS